jgi:hypothetical protein
MPNASFKGGLMSTSLITTLSEIVWACTGTIIPTSKNIENTIARL